MRFGPTLQIAIDGTAFELRIATVAAILFSLLNALAIAPVVGCAEALSQNERRTQKRNAQHADQKLSPVPFPHGRSPLVLAVRVKCKRHAITATPPVARSA